MSYIDKYQPSGIKIIGDYTYILLISKSTDVLIERLKTDNTEIKFKGKPKDKTIEEFLRYFAIVMFI